MINIDNLITMISKIKSKYDSGKIKSFLEAKDMIKKDYISISKEYNITEIEKNINIFNDFFNSALFKEIILENTESDIEILYSWLLSTQEKILNIVNEINTEKTLTKKYFSKNSDTIEVNDFVKQITLHADFFAFNYAAEFILEIDGKKYNILPFDFEGQYMEELKNNKTKFDVNINDNIYFYSSTMNKINLEYDKDYLVKENKIELNTLNNSYSKVYVEYDPVHSSFFIKLNKNIKNIKLIIDNKTQDIFGIENFYIKVRY